MLCAETTRTAFIPEVLYRNSYLGLQFTMDRFVQCVYLADAEEKAEAIAEAKERFDCREAGADCLYALKGKAINGRHGKRVADKLSKISLGQALTKRSAKIAKSREAVADAVAVANADAVADAIEERKKTAKADKRFMSRLMATKRDNKAMAEE